MIQVRNICTVKYGSFREFVHATEELMEICRQRGWAPGNLLTPMAGVNNQVVWQVEYPDLPTMQQENEAAQTDPEFMKIFRSAGELLYPESARTEILETAPHIA
jgi:hypothetical protein